VKTTQLLAMHDPNTLTHAAQALRAGHTVIFPTETVYGLGANALDERALEAIYEAKGRPQDNPLIVHIAELEQLKTLIRGTLSPEALTCIKAFWPGPLTLILPKHPDLSDRISAGLDTVGVRMPDHPFALALIQAAGVPVAAPSANRSGDPSPTQLEHVKASMMGRVDVMIEGDVSRVGLESTVLDLTQDPPCILRPGVISFEQLQPLLPTLISAHPHDSVHTPKSPGMKYRHYAPKAEMLMVQGARSAVIQTMLKLTQPNDATVAILCAHEHIQDYPERICIDLGPLNQPAILAANLYACLHQCDAYRKVYSEAFDERDIGVALMDRLTKAVGHRILKV
jgi:L-threonylcarbamoyladenylate synthase